MPLTPAPMRWITLAALLCLCVAPMPLLAEPSPACFLESYPGIACGFGDNALTLCNGQSVAWDDGQRDKTHEQWLDAPDLEDTLAQPYPRGPLTTALPIDFEPGRARHARFLAAVYGSSPDDVRPLLRAVPWPGSGKRLRVTTVNGVADQLAAVAKAVATLPRSVRLAVATVGGGYNHRVIAGTHRASAHSYGIAVDVGMDRAEYWRWRLRPGGAFAPLKNRFPAEVVELFEQHGFIWGGKWYRYDTMHFEHRPELLHPACASAKARD